MKMIAATIAALLITAATGCARDSAPPCYVMIGVGGGPTNATLTIQGKTVSLEEMGRVMKKLGALSAEQVILVGVDAESPSHRLLAVLKVLTDAGLQNVCVLPKGSTGLTAQHLRVLTRTNEFFQVETEELTEPEIIDITEEGRTNGPTVRATARP